ncbi:hypothetical protein LA521A_17080 [Lysobacter auxotrophicus]|uniref:Uncharacterized protein n=1 Tax=Lysobacter auxotrophicus TaxID=2992573 RepID=A0ABN6UJL8_9GAMM|nr:hypothetical protein [Lysobacter auxotrophicus]BDU16507.1 hypothetical protein LA521A_17080 [Lysobacter auxotrophicus]
MRVDRLARLDGDRDVGIADAADAQDVARGLDHLQVRRDQRRRDRDDERGVRIARTGDHRDPPALAVTPVADRRIAQPRVARKPTSRGDGVVGECGVVSVFQIAHGAPGTASIEHQHGDAQARQAFVQALEDRRGSLATGCTVHRDQDRVDLPVRRPMERSGQAHVTVAEGHLFGACERIA